MTYLAEAMWAAARRSRIWSNMEEDFDGITACYIIAILNSQLCSIATIVVE